MFDRCDAVVTNTIDLLGIGPANALRQIDERSIEFILEERSVGAGTAGTNVSLVDDDYIESFVGEGVRDEGPGDSCTQNDNIALQILPERGINAQQTILQRPEGSRRNQIHAQHWLCQTIVVEKYKERLPLALCLNSSFVPIKLPKEVEGIRTATR
jgi:hypothetical protein